MSVIPYIDESGLDQATRHLFALAEQRGAPNANLCRVLGHNSEILRGFFRLWNGTFQEGALDHRLKELVRVKIATMYGCGY